MENFCLLLCFFLLFTVASTEKAFVRNQEELNYYAHIIYKDEFKCSGVLVSTKYVLTAVRCMCLNNRGNNTSENYKDYRVCLGSSEKNSGPRFPVKNVIPYHKNPEFYYTHNIALVELDKLQTYPQFKPTPIQLATTKPVKSLDDERTIRFFGFNMFHPDNNMKHPELISDEMPITNFLLCKRFFGDCVPWDNVCMTENENFSRPEEGAPAIVDGKLYAIRTHDDPTRKCKSVYILVPYLRISIYRNWIREIAEV